MNSVRSSILGRSNASPIVTRKARRGTLADDLTSVPVPRAEARTVNQRGDDRHRLVDKRIRIRFDGAEASAELINLSAGGATIRAAIQPRLWDRVDLLFSDDNEAEAAVCWIRDGRLGLEFAPETQLRCPPELHDEILRRVVETSLFEIPEQAAPESAAAAADGGLQQPRPSRHPLIWCGEILFDHDAHKVRLRNISEAGALIEADGDFPLGGEVFLDLGKAGTVFAHINWARGGQHGLSFQEPFDLTRLALHKPGVVSAEWIRPDYLRSEQDSDSPWAGRWDRLSRDDLKRD